MSYNSTHQDGPEVKKNNFLMTIFFNEGDENYKNNKYEYIKNVGEIIYSHNPKYLFIGTQETTYSPSKIRFKNSIQNYLKNKYTKIKEIEGPHDIPKIPLLPLKTIVSSLFERNDGNKQENNKKIEFPTEMQEVIKTPECSFTITKGSIFLFFNYDKKEYCIVNSHLSFNDKPGTLHMRKKQFLCLIEKVSEYVDSKIILFGGDLNFRKIISDSIIQNSIKKNTSFNSLKSFFSPSSKIIPKKVVSTQNQQNSQKNTSEGNTSQGITSQGITSQGITSQKNTSEGNTIQRNTSQKNTSEGNTSEGITSEGNTCQKNTNSLNVSNHSLNNSKQNYTNTKPNNNVNGNGNSSNTYLKENIVISNVTIQPTIFQTFKNELNNIFENEIPKIEKKIKLLKNFKNNLSKEKILTCKYEDGKDTFVKEKKGKPRIPSMCDKILYSFPDSIPKPPPLEINVIPRIELLVSDHLLIYAVMPLFKNNFP